MIARIFLSLIGVCSISTALGQQSLKNEVPTESISDGFKKVTSVMKVIPGHSIWLSLEMRPKKLVTIAISGKEKHVRYDEVKVVAHDASGQALTIKPEYEDIKNFNSSDAGPGNGYDAFGIYTMADRETNRLFSVDVTYAGKTLSFKLPAPK